MIISELLIWSGPTTYILVWIIVLLLLLIYDLSAIQKTILLTYAIVPIGSITQSAAGCLLSVMGL
jgi:hypothetical protein